MTPSQVPGAYWSSASAAGAECASATQHPGPIARPIRSAGTAALQPQHERSMGAIPKMYTTQLMQGTATGMAVQQKPAATPPQQKSFLLDAKKILMQATHKSKKPKGDLPASCPQIPEVPHDKSDTKSLR